MLNLKNSNNWQLLSKNRKGVLNLVLSSWKAEAGELTLRPVKAAN